MENDVYLPLEAIEVNLARTEFLDFIEYVSDNDITWFHETYYKILHLFAIGKIKKLIVTVPPQHGKSDGSTRHLPAFLHGLNPNLKIAIGSYSDPFAQKFNRDIQRIIDSPKYKKVFPNTTLNGSNVVTITNSYLRNSHEFEIVGYKGKLKAVGRKGGLTGEPVDIMIMDDLYKDKMEGNSPLIRQTVIEWYTSVIIKRLHNNSQQLIVFTRWHEDDLIGYLETNDQVINVNSWQDIADAPAEAWIKINFEAIKETEPTELDPRQKGEPLWGDKHSIEKLENERKLDPLTFDCMNQGNPNTKEGLLYGDFKTYSSLPAGINNYIKNQTDTADEGDDMLCSISYIEHNKLKYIIDVLYTEKPNEFTEPALADMLSTAGVNVAIIEANNGGRAFARNVERLCRERNNYKTSFRTPTQSQNKIARILTNSTTVTNTIVFPDNWMHRWPVFYKDVTKFRADFSSKHDDAPDVLTSMVEVNTKLPGIIYA